MPETETQLANREGESESQALAPLNIIRTETVFSRLPIHILAKKGRVDIHIIRKNDQGEIELHWEILSYDEKNGPPRRLAYKLDTTIIDRRIDEIGRPIPPFIRLGSLRDIAKELGIGGDTNLVKKALRQNSHTFIKSKLTYKDKDGTNRWIDAEFNRYNIVFAGEELPNGKKADSVYIALNNPYWEVLNTAPVRPLDYDYLRELPPAPQRLYELISYQMFAAIKHRLPYAKLQYSEFCTFAPQTRYYDWEQVRKQMSKVHRPHIRSGYISKVEYQPITDEEDKLDWIILYRPGQKARVQHATFTRRRAIAEAGERDVEPQPIPGAATHEPEQNVDPVLLAEMTRRGISEARARKLLLNLAEDQQVLDQLEYGDHIISQAPPGKFYSPSGFYIHLVQTNAPVPDTFETSRKRQEREEARQAHQRERAEQMRLELAYHEYKEQAISRHIQTMYTQTQYQDEIALKKRELLHQNKMFAKWSEETFTSFAEHQVKAAIATLAPLLSFEAFSEQQRQKQQDPPQQQPVEPAPPPEPATDDAEARKAYDQYVAGQIDHALSDLTREERGRRLEEARAYLLTRDFNQEHYRQLQEQGKYKELHDGAERKMRELLAQSLNLPPFEAWKQNRGTFTV